VDLRNALPVRGPERILVASTFINTFGNGLFSVVSVLYFSRILGFSATQIGLAFTIAGIAEVIAAFPSGYIADRVDPVKLSVVATFATGLVSVGYFFINSYFLFVLQLAVIGFVDGVGRTARQTVIARVADPDGKVRLRAYLRAVTNVGIAFGSVVAGLALIVDSKAAYLTMIGLDILTYWVTATIVARLPALPPHPQARDHIATLALRDKPFVALTLVNAVMSMHYLILDIVLPLWISGHTTAPRAMVAVVFVINTVVVALFQIRASKGTEEPLPAAYAMRKAGLIIFLACAIYSASSYPESPWIAAGILALGGTVHVLGELKQAAGSWGIGFGLPPESAQGQYQAVWGLGFSLNSMIAPIALTALCITLGVPGWLLLGAIISVAGILAVPLTRWALKGKIQREKLLG
jgi:MFS family permease